MNFVKDNYFFSGYLDGAVEAGNNAAIKIVQRIQSQFPNFKLEPNTELYKIINQPPIYPSSQLSFLARLAHSISPKSNKLSPRF